MHISGVLKWSKNDTCKVPSPSTYDVAPILKLSHLIQWQFSASHLSTHPQAVFHRIGHFFHPRFISFHNI